MQAVDVIFRVFNDVPGANEEPFALFPGLAGTNDTFTCLCYAHTGQHGSADLSKCMMRSRPAKPDEYAPLVRELERVGYSVNRVSRVTGSHTKQRMQQV